MYGRLCPLCNTIKTYFHSHHINYEKNETIDVCTECHVAIHKKGIRPDLLPKDKKILIIQIPEELHSAIKIQAAKEKITLARYVTLAMEEKCNLGALNHTQSDIAQEDIQ